MNQLAKILILTGALLIIVGIFIVLWGDRLPPLGKLPGDIRIEKDNFKFYFPITTMLIVSIIVTLIIRLFQRFL